MADPFTLSDVMGYVSIACWLGAQFPQVLENIRRQSCEGLALPFLANWLLGDISNLVGCILTHQLPFQTWLATYFVFVDCTLVAQYFYYARPPKLTQPSLSHLRATASPAALRRMSLDRGTSRYRTLSAVAANVAAAAALAAQQDHHADRKRVSTRHTHYGTESSHEGASSLTRAPVNEEDDEDAFAAMADSFHSEGGYNIGRKRVSWSIERQGVPGQQHPGLPTSASPAVLQFLSETDSLSRGRSMERDLEADDQEEELTPTTSQRRSSRASRKGATVIFLGVWSLFGIFTLAGSKPGVPWVSTTKIGRVISPRDSIPKAVSITGISDSPSIPTHVYETSDSAVDLLSIPFLDEAPHNEPYPGAPSPERVLGRIFAWMCTTLYLTSRLPQIWKNFVRKSVEGLSMYLFVFAFLGNTFYVASILFSPKTFLPPPESTAFLRESIPYLLGSAGTLMFDVTIVMQSFIYRPRSRRHILTHSRLTEEETGLLSEDTLLAHPSGSDSAASIMNRGRTSRTRTTA